MSQAAGGSVVTRRSLDFSEESIFRRSTFSPAISTTPSSSASSTAPGPSTAAARSAATSTRAASNTSSAVGTVRESSKSSLNPLVQLPLNNGFSEEEIASQKVLSEVTKVNREAHDRRVADLLKSLEFLDRTAWAFDPPESFLQL
ncbi:unnamed protein product [Cyprideis torosa]|uniref:Uncharacterized protein n=1 Tax=Cyprideis torosa TaxID=163714 RepID=A0A7R8WB53_9CRUS|nr:unnamed protein product [Cyprideis torosa]CAG0885952.1 unnamed protein product [Cyprideis torosa]